VDSRGDLCGDNGSRGFLPKLGLGPTRGYSAINSVAVNLRSLDRAIQTWALDKGVTNVTASPAWNDIFPYLMNGQKPKPLAGEQYVPGRLCDGPSAILTRKFLNHPKGTIIRIATNGQVEFLKPTN